MNNQAVEKEIYHHLPVQTTPRTRRKRQNHGLSGLIKGRSKADIRQIDGRSALAISMNAYRTNLVASLGGADNLSQQELTVVDICGKDWIILQAGTFNRRKKSCYAITVQRMQIADSLTRRLQALGLTKRARPVKSLNELLTPQPEPAQAVDAGTASVHRAATPLTQTKEDV